MNDELYNVIGGNITTVTTLYGAEYSNLGNGWNTTYTIKTDDSEKVEKLEKEIKELRKRISKLATLICTHIGEEQLKNFNDGK